MLKSLFGSQSVSRVLLFLLVNEEGYAHQLQRSLDLSLTPIQKALSRLEDGGVLMSRFEKKQRIYFFNPDYLLLESLCQLLKRAYNELPLEEKKLYYFLPHERRSERKEMLSSLNSIWHQLESVSQVTLIARSRRDLKGGFFRKGKGKVDVTKENSSLLFEEKGIWQGDERVYQNRFRFSIDRSKGLISLEHLRFGVTRPVFLFDLYSEGGGVFKSVTPHLCGEDTYFGWLEKGDLFVHLHVRTLGPKKDEKIEYAYA